jgi:hypothetical protein
MKTILLTILCLFLAIPALAQPRIYAPDGTYLGTLSNNPYASDSTSNPYGVYGSRYSPYSINNPYGVYGSPYSPQSPNNPYANTTPPQYQQHPRTGLLQFPQQPLLPTLPGN